MLADTAGLMQNYEKKGEEPMVWLLLAAAVLLLTVPLSLLIAGFRWRYKNRRYLEKLTVPARGHSDRLCRGEIPDGLPEPVQRYLHTVLVHGTQLIRGVRVLHRGSFNMSENGSVWKSFTSRQRVSIYPPGFLWDARISVFPGLDVRVHDAYISGEGILQASLAGLIPLAELSGPGEMARGELMRYLAEAAWYPTALLPDRNLHWEPVNRQSARAVLRDGRNEISLLFRFSKEGLISSVYSAGRERMAAGKMETVPWEGRWSTYQERRGMLIPLSGEALWLLPDGEKAYWRGEITQIQYEFADTEALPASTKG